jgi:hypothetical protein
MWIVFSVFGIRALVFLIFVGSHAIDFPPWRCWQDLKCYISGVARFVWCLCADFHWETPTSWSLSCHNSFEIIPYPLVSVGFVKTIALLWIIILTLDCRDQRPRRNVHLAFISCWTLYTAMLVTVCRRVRKIAKSFVLFACLSASTWRILMKFDIWLFYENLSKKFNFR